MLAHVPSGAALRAIAALCVSAFATACGATDSLAAAECKNGVCVANVYEDKAPPPCADASEIILAWRQAGGATLIQCETSDAEMDKPSFIYNRDALTAPAYAVTGMRYFDAGVLAAGGVSDQFASRDFCKGTKPARMATGEILVGEKIPSPDDDNAYCYRVIRISSTAGGVAVKADDNKNPKPEAKHADWDRLAAHMTALIRAHAGAAPAAAAPAAATQPAPAAAAIAHVVGAKAPLRDTPDAGVAQHGYLVQGDEVSVLDRSKAAEGWLKVRYVAKSGKAIDRWVRVDDLDVANNSAAVH
jgi:hypothetical protein